ncbi:MAG: rRNA pseudouridine synthase [Firmicutes bacterium]|nr:rRNA pseudouridine synthase [Bacillota bacterium]
MAKDTRIDRLFSNLGLMTRSQCKKAVKGGGIAVNGSVCRSEAEKVDPDADKVTWDGRPVDTRRFVYYMLNKPAGVITAARDPKSPTVMDLISDARTDLFAVGRLDMDTTGLLLITNDGQLGHRLLSPRYHVAKTYEARISGVLTEDDIAALEAGVDIGDDSPTLPAKVTPLNAGGPQSSCADASGAAQKVLLTITEGRYHQVKRMFEAVGKPVLTLHRSSFGPLELDPALKPGEYREITEDELKQLKKCAQ